MGILQEKKTVFFPYRSVGVLAYFLLTGVSPFLGESKAETLSNITQMKIDYPADLFESISPAALDFIRSLIKRDPRQVGGGLEGGKKSLGKFN